MEFSYALVKFFFIATAFSSVIQVDCCLSGGISFNLKDPESNEVITEGQEKVVLICHVETPQRVNINILNVNGLVVENNSGVGNCIEHTISQLSEEDKGEYTCNAVVRSQGVSLCKKLSLNVESGSQQCFRNGTEGQAFGVGDVLQLSCYCTSTINCHWISTVVGSRNGTNIPFDEREMFDGDKVIIRVVVGPLTESDFNTRYDCYYGSLSSQRCSLGPSYNCSSDAVLNPIDSSTVLRECPKLSTTPLISTATDQYETDSNDVTLDGQVAISGATETSQKTRETPDATDEPKEDFIQYIITGGVILLIIIILILVLVFFALKRNRRVESSEPKGDVVVDGLSKDSVHQNDAYEETPELQRNGISESPINPAINCSTHTDMVEHPPSHSDHEDEMPTYAFVDKTRTPDMKQQRMLRAELVGDEDDDSEDKFCQGDIIEYGVPMAFRTDSYSEDTRQGSDSHGLQSDEI